VTIHQITSLKYCSYHNKPPESNRLQIIKQE
jgi:hypothetical protein